jgi:hypothetical protein
VFNSSAGLSTQLREIFYFSTLLFFRTSQDETCQRELDDAGSLVQPRLAFSHRLNRTDRRVVWRRGAGARNGFYSSEKNKLPSPPANLQANPII